MPKKTSKKDDDIILLDKSTNPLPQTPTLFNENGNTLIQHKSSYSLRPRAIPSHVLYEEIPLVIRKTSVSLKGSPPTPSRKQPGRKAKGLVPFITKGLVEQNTLDNSKRDTVESVYDSSTEKTKDKSIKRNIITIDNSKDKKNINLQQGNIEPDEENIDTREDDVEQENIEQDERDIIPCKSVIEYDEENVEQDINLIPDETRIETDEENMQLDVSTVGDNDDEGPEDMSFFDVKTQALAQLRQEEETAQRYYLVHCK